MDKIINQVRKKNLRNIINNDESVLFKHQTPGPTICRPSLYWLLGLNK